MDSNKKKQIAEVMGLYKHSLLDVTSWLNRVAPNVKPSANKAYMDGMNAFLGALVGQQHEPKPGTPIPYEAEDRLGRDMWLFLGNHGITLEDIVDYVGEAQAERKTAEENKSMKMSQMLHALPGGAEGAAEIFAQHQRLKKEAEGFNMSEFLKDMPAGYGEQQ